MKTTYYNAAEQPGLLGPGNRIRAVFVMAWLLWLAWWPAQVGAQTNVAFTAVAPEVLSNSYVRCFLQDSQGYLWMGTADGLVRYDGTNTYRYVHDPGDAFSIPHNNINGIAEDQNKQLWVATSQGMCRFNRELDHFVEIDQLPEIQNYLDNRYTTTITVDRDNRLWIGTLGGGINVLDQEAGKFTYVVDSLDDKKNYINSILSVNGQMWCGTKGGVIVLDRRTLERREVNVLEGQLPQNQVTQLVLDKRGNIWLSTLDGEISRISPGNGYFVVKKVLGGVAEFGPSWNNIITLAFDPKGNLWIGGDKSGLNYLNVQTGEVTRLKEDPDSPGAFPSNSVRYVYVDPEERTWIGTYAKGAYMIDDRPGKFNRYQGNGWNLRDFSGMDITAITEDQQGNIWLAVNGQGLRRLEAGSQKLHACREINLQLANKYISALTSDRHGNLWIGTVGNGVLRFTPGTRQIKAFQLIGNGFGDNKAYSLYEDHNGRIWAGSFGSGLFFLDDQRQEFVLLCEEEQDVFIPRTSYVSAFADAWDGGLWVATMYGLYRLTEKPDGSYDYEWFLQETAPGHLSSSAIQTIYEDQNHVLWIGTIDNGLSARFPGKDEFEAVTGPASNAIRAIVEDGTGNIWVSGNMGLSRYQPTSNTCVSYSREDGLASNNFNINACLRGRSGELFFGSNNGLNVFFPDSIDQRPLRPAIYLTDLRINNQSVPIGGEDSPLSRHISMTSAIDLSYEQRSFALDFIAVDYSGANNYEYCYRLEGFDRDWNCIGPNHSATYTNLDPGSYTFRVRVSDGTGGWTEMASGLEVVIQPLLWKTWWAITLYLMVIGSAVFFLVKAHNQRVRMQHQLEFERMAREREHELGESKTQFFTNISHELRTPLSLISMPLENLISSGNVPPAAEERLLTIKTNADKMTRLVNELMDFSKLEKAQLRLNVFQGELVRFVHDTAVIFNDLAQKRNIRFDVHAEVEALVGWFDEDKLEKILVNVLSNAFKFTSEGGEIHLFIDSRKCSPCAETQPCRCLELVIVDNGIGIPEEELPFIFNKFYQARSSPKIANQGTGIGLSLTKGLVELHKGSISAHSTPEHETKFVIRIPIDRQVFEGDEACTVHDRLENAETRHSQGGGGTGEDGNEQPGKSTILIVEDHDELRSYLAMELGREFHIIQARDGREGIDMAGQQLPDLIISDVLMPYQSGIDLCQEIKTNLKTSHIPVILLSAKGAIDDQLEGVNTGADLYITKPFSIRILAAHVRQMVESRQKLYSRFSHDVYLLPARVTTNELDQAFLQKAIDYILENLLDPQLGVDSIAGLFSMSRMQVYRKIKALTGSTVVEFIRTVRIKQALRLMEAQTYSLAEIAYQTGFNSASYFSKCFKDHFGKAPSEYLESHSAV